MKTHGQTNSRTYRIWVQMRRRCRDPRSSSFCRYGAIGITVCDRWLNSFENFIADMGECPEGMSIERKENSIGYTPDNCKWATSEEQNNNRSNNVYLEHDGRRLTVRQWSRELGISGSTLHGRLRKGLSVSEILAPPQFTKGVRKSRYAKTQTRIERDGKRISIRQAALNAGLNYKTVNQRIRSGCSIDAALSPISRKTGEFL